MTHEKTYQVMLTMEEMKAISFCMTALFNRMADEKRTPSPELAVHVTNALYKMKAASEADAIVVVRQ